MKLVCSQRQSSCLRVAHKVAQLGHTGAHVVQCQRLEQQGGRGGGQGGGGSGLGAGRCAAVIQVPAPCLLALATHHIDRVGLAPARQFRIVVGARPNLLHIAQQQVGKDVYARLLADVEACCVDEGEGGDAGCRLGVLGCHSALTL